MKAKLIILSIVGLATASVMTLSAQSKSQWDGVYTDAQAKRGQDVYVKYKCLSCHGMNLEGYTLEMNPAPELTGPEFVKSWSNFTLFDLYEKIHTSMPQDDPGTVKPEEVADVISYMLQVGKYPAGSTELKSAEADLKGIKFLAAKP